MQRKMLLICIVCLVAVSRPAWAGDGSSLLQVLAVGGKVGMNAATRGGEHADGLVLKTNYKLSFSAGGFANVRLHQWFAIQPEILFVMKGANREADGRDRGSHNLNYIVVPILLHGRYSVRDGLAIHGLLGPEMGFLVSAEVRNENGDTLDLRNETNLIDVGLIFGAGMSWRYPQKGAFLFEARYDLGLRSIDRDEGVDVKNRVLSFMIGYQWEIGSR
jgi:hypothetical protein